MGRTTKGSKAKVKVFTVTPAVDLKANLVHDCDVSP